MVDDLLIILHWIIGQRNYPKYCFRDVSSTALPLDSLQKRAQKLVLFPKHIPGVLTMCRDGCILSGNLRVGVWSRKVGEQ